MSASAPVELTTNYSSVARPVDAGSEFGSEPVAIIMFFALIYSVPPAFKSTSMSLADANFPQPFIYVTPFFLKRYSIPPVSPLTVVSFVFII